MAYPPIAQSATPKSYTSPSVMAAPHSCTRRGSNLYASGVVFEPMAAHNLVINVGASSDKKLGDFFSATEMVIFASTSTEYPFIVSAKADKATAWDKASPANLSPRIRRKVTGMSQR